MFITDHPRNLWLNFLFAGGLALQEKLFIPLKNSEVLWSFGRVGSKGILLYLKGQFRSLWLLELLFKYITVQKRGKSVHPACLCLNIYLYIIIRCTILFLIHLFFLLVKKFKSFFTGHRRYFENTFSWPFCRFFLIFFYQIFWPHFCTW